MDDLRIGQPYWVNTESSGGVNLDLRREPNMNPKTEAGEDNVILSMSHATCLVLDSREAHTSDGHTWYKVRCVYDNVDETGWVISDFLEMWFPVPAAATVFFEVEHNKNREFDVACPQSDPPRFSQGLVRFKEPGGTNYILYIS